MLGDKPKIHFVGIGGIGMSGIAELLIKQGYNVTGSDLRKTDITEHLREIGADIIQGHDSNIVKNADVIVKSSAVRDDNPEIIAAKSNKIPVIRRAEMLSEIMRMSYGIAVAGTHGKTTTTSLVGMVLQNADLAPTIIVGGKIMNIGSNNLLGSGKHIVVEADEFDRSFLSLTPIIAGITNIEADHLDCYDNLEDIKNAFIQYANKVPFFGSIVLCLDDHGSQSIIPYLKKRIITYGLSKQADIRAENIEMNEFVSKFDVYYKHNKLTEIELNIPGHHNILNSLMAISIGLELDIPIMTIKEGLRKFKGVFRRFEFKGKFDKALLYDDYAHHPTEIQATLKGVKENTDKRIVVVFQPHLYSRTRDFHEEFGKSFFQSDVLIITPIYPAREDPIPGITGKLIANDAIQHGHRNVIYIDNNKDIIPKIREIFRENDIIITMGAGDIYRYGERLIGKDK